MKFITILITVSITVSTAIFVSGCAGLAGSSITIAGGYEGATGSITYTYNPTASTVTGSTVLTKDADKSLSVVLDSEEIKNLTDSVFTSVKSVVPDTDEMRIKKLKEFMNSFKNLNKPIGKLEADKKEIKK